MLVSAFFSRTESRRSSKKEETGHCREGAQATTPSDEDKARPEAGAGGRSSRSTKWEGEEGCCRAQSAGREEEAERAQGSSASASAGAGASTQPSPRRPATKRAIPPGAEVIDVTSGRESMRRGAARRGHTGVLERWLKREPEG